LQLTALETKTLKNTAYIQAVENVNDKTKLINKTLNAKHDK